MKLVLESCGEKKICVIREIRAFTEATLKDSKDLAETPGAVVFDGPGRVGYRFHKALLAQGARVTIAVGGNPVSRWLRALADWIEG